MVEEFVIEETLEPSMEASNPLGSMLFPQRNVSDDIPPMASYPLQRSNKASTITKVYGTARVAGNVLWMGPNHPWQTKESAGGKGGGGSSVVTDSGNRRSFLIGVCEGPAIVLRVWRNKELIALNGLTFFRGDGSADTGINDLIDEEFANYPNTCCVYFNEYEIGTAGTLPNFTFEVTDQFDPTKTQIYNAEDLQAINDDLSGDYEIMTDIDLSGVSWTMLGPSNPAPFMGTLDGRHHLISNLSISIGNDDNAALFGWTSGAAITRTHCRDFTLQGFHGIATLISDCDKTNVTYCSGTGSITGRTLDNRLADSGGLIAITSGTLPTNIIQYCWADVDMSNGSISSSGEQLGGFIGIPGGAYSILDCYSKGAMTTPVVHPAQNIGWGNFAGDSLASVDISRCYSSGSTQANWVNNTTRQAFSGNSSLGTGSDNFWDGEAAETPALSTDFLATEKTTAQMYAEATFTNYDFDTVWEINEGQGYPTLIINENTLVLDANPSVIIKDLLTNTRYGAGLDESTWIDTTSFDEVEAYCDANGLRFSFALDRQRPAVDWIQYILDHFIGYMIMSQGKLKLGIFKDES